MHVVLCQYAKSSSSGVLHLQATYDGPDEEDVELQRKMDQDMQGEEDGEASSSYSDEADILDQEEPSKEKATKSGLRIHSEVEVSKTRRPCKPLLQAAEH